MSKQINHQIYVIAPLIIESEKIDLENVLKLEEKMKKAFGKVCNIGVMHGKMSANEKEEVMENFKQNKIQILISTTVIEVGVDVKNATMIVIFDSFRFGLSALHQLRGRVGRNDLNSYCILISDKETKRLEILTKTNDDRAQLYEYDEETVENQIDSIISPKDCNKDCSNCRYRQAFFDSKSNVLTNNQTSYNANQDTPKIPEQNFYDDIAEQLEEMFDKYPTETNLTAMIPNSRWIKIDYYNKDGYYCIGIIKDNNNVRYIGYAMPSRVNLPPPDDITEYAQFLPIGDGENGYYVVYQDAQNGESIKISFC